MPTILSASAGTFKPEVQPQTSDRAKVTPTLPYLWVTDIIAAQPLIGLGAFAGVFSPEAPGNEPGHHILCLDPDTPELVWKAIAYDLINQGCQVSVCQLGTTNMQPLEWYLAETPVQEAAIHIVMYHIAWDNWQKGLDNELDTEEARELAKLALVKIRDDEKQTDELEKLRRRCGVSEYNWDKKYLEPLRAKLERDLALSDASQKEATLDERLTLEIKILLKEHNPSKRLLKINDVASRFRMGQAQVYGLMREIGRETKTPECSCLSFDELLELETEGIEYLIPGMLPKGETVLCAGMPKAGKTLLAIDAAFAIATGESYFLGEKVQQGKVLLISVDESAQSTKSKLVKRGFRKGDQIHVMTNWDISQLDVLEQKLEDSSFDLVVIDSLKRIMLGREVSENSAEFADMIYQLKELTGRYGAACLLIHHTNKNPDAMGVARIRGNTAIAGAVWGTWLLDRVPVQDPNNKKRLIIDPSDPRRTLSVIPRDSQGQNLKLEFNPDNLSFSPSSEEDEAQEERKNQRQQILELLAKYFPSGLTGREILEEIGLPRSAYNSLNRLVEQRLITQRQSTTDHRMMVYCLPGHSPSPHVEKVMTNLSESIVVEPKTNSHHLVIESEKISHHHFEPTEGDDNLTSELVDNTAISHQETPSVGGRGSAQPVTPSQTSHVSPASDTSATSSVATQSESLVGQWCRTKGLQPQLVKVTKWNEKNGFCSVVHQSGSEDTFYPCELQPLAGEEASSSCCKGTPEAIGTWSLLTEELLGLLGWEEHQLDQWWHGETFEVSGYSIRYLGATIRRWEVIQR